MDMTEVDRWKEYVRIRDARIEELERQLAEAQSNRDKDWVLAIAAALGTDSNYNVPIVPEPGPFRKLFAAIAETAPDEVQALNDQYQEINQHLDGDM